MTAGDLAELPASLLDIPLSKVHALSEAAQGVMRIAAAAGRRANHELLAAIAEVDDAVLSRSLREALDRQVIVVDADAESYSFRHALIQQAVYAELLPGERRRLHGALARTLTDSPELSPRGAATAVAEVAHHWYSASDRPKALRAAVAAAEAAEAVYAYAEALGHLSRAITLWERVPDAALVAGIDRVALQARTAHVAGLIGEYERAAAVVADAIERVDADAEPERAGLLHEQLGSYHMSGGDEVRAAEAFARAVDLVPATPPSPGRACVLISAGQLAMLSSRYDEAEALAGEALAVARAVGDRSTEARSLGTLGVVVSHRGRPDTAIDLMREAIGIARAADDAPKLASLYINLGHVLGLASRLEEAVEASVEGYEEVRALGLGRQAGTYLKCNAAWALFKLGRWDEAGARWKEAAAGGMRGIREVSLLLACAELDIAQGRFDTARQRLDRAVLLSERVWAPLFYRRELLEQRAELALWQADLDGARAAAAEGIALVTGTDDERFGGKLVVLGLRAEADRIQGGRSRQLAAEVDRAAGDLLATAGRFRPSPLEPDSCGLPEAHAFAAVLLAECSRGQGRPSPELWDAAAKRWEELRRPYPAAYARWREGEAWLATGDRGQAAEALAAALDAARRLGAVPLASGVEDVARRARIRLDKPAAAGERPAWAEAGLTSREAEVLALVAAGRTNAEIGEALFISQSTAGVHVSRILTKLGVPNRGQAAAAAHRLGLLGDLSSG